MKKLFSREERIAYYRREIERAQAFVNFASRRIESLEAQDIKVQFREFARTSREGLEGRNRPVVKKSKGQKGKGAG